MNGVDAGILRLCFFNKLTVMSTKRKSISKRLRFEVFKRDSFCCQYCSAKPPHVPLEVDHIVPVIKGGTNDIYNLITSCFDCNRGKGKTELSSIPETLVDKIEQKKVAQSQYKQYLKLIDLEKKQMEKDIESVEEIYSNIFPGWCFSESFKISVKKFITALGVIKVQHCMETACSRKRLDEDKALRYFCGICWNHIREM